MKNLLIPFLLFCSLNCNSQDWKQITSLNNINHFAVAENGDIWSTTLSGVVHYNGDTSILYNSENTKNFPNLFSRFSDIEIDNYGIVWAGVNDNLCKFENGSWEYFNAPGGSFFNDIVIDKDSTLWYGNRGSSDKDGLYKFDGKNWQTWGETDGLVNRHVNTIAIDSKNNTIWIGTSGGVSVFNGNSFTSYTENDGLIANSVNSIKIDLYGNKWIGAYGGLSVYDDTKWISYQESDGLISNNIIDIEINAANIIWVATDKGISTFDGQTWTNFNSLDLLYTQYIYDLNQDNNGNILAATDVGILKYNGTEWITLFKDTTLASSQILDIIIDGSDIWIANTHGISIFNNGNWKNYNAQNVLPANNVNSIFFDNKDNKWVATQNGICKFDGFIWNCYTEEDGLISNKVRDIAIDSSQNIWLGTELGISKFDGSNWTNYNTDDGLNNNYVRCVFVDDLNNIWAGTNRGISKFDGEKWENVSDPSGPWESSSIWCIEQDINGNIWFGTDYHGLWLFDGSEWQHITSINGLDFRWVYAIKKDAHNNIWMGSYSLNGLKIFNGVDWYGYSDEDGLTDMNIYCINFGTKGDAYIGTIAWGGLFILQQPEIPIAANLSKDSLTVFANEASSDTISITTFAAWNISCDKEWVNFKEADDFVVSKSGMSTNFLMLKELNGEGNSTIIVQLDENPSANSRTATITISAYGKIVKTINVVQKGKTTAIDEFSGTEIRIYPNPVSKLLTIETKREYHSIAVIDITGKVLKMVDCRGQTNVQIDMGSLEPGLYFIRLQGIYYESVPAGTVVKKVFKR